MGLPLCEKDVSALITSEPGSHEVIRIYSRGRRKRLFADGSELSSAVNRGGCGPVSLNVWHRLSSTWFFDDRSLRLFSKMSRHGASA